MVHLDNKARATEYITGQSYPLVHTKNPVFQGGGLMSSDS